MSFIPATKFGDCTQCSAKNVRCRKRGKDLICLNCIRGIDTSKQVQKALNREKEIAVKEMNPKEKREVKKRVASSVRSLVTKQKAPDKLLDLWFMLVRRKLTGTCQCGCGKPSSKNDDKYYKHSCCHLFPKRIFKSIATHPKNYIERAFWGGCHTNLDEQGIDKWPFMADWEHIKELFHELAPLLTDEERTSKFYSNFEKLIYAN
ncbi:MAG: hypothetical protein KA161_07690 [Saprospiraceae bacterium]|nr:hypothetical protein [Saprospiraceae bacterium]